MAARNDSEPSGAAVSAGHESSRRAVAAHAAPYLLWIAPLAVFAVAAAIGAPVPNGWLAPVYAAKSLLCALLILWLKPWRFYAPGDASVQSSKFKVHAFGVCAGLLVALLWVFPETPWLFERTPGFADFYNRWLIMPPADWPSYFRPDIFPALPANHPSLSYAPEMCGWPLTIAKLIGSAFVISAAEEWFFRGFLYRWLRKGDFLSVDPARYDAQAFWLVVLVFGLEHDRWLAGMMAGVVYGWLVLRTGRIGPAIVAHATTNLALGVYVILSRQYGFW